MNRLRPNIIISILAYISFSFFVLFLSPALSQVSFTMDEVAFNGENPDLEVQDFGFAPVDPGDDLFCPDPANSESNNDCFTPGDILPGIEFDATPNEDPDNGLRILGEDFFDPGEPPAPVITSTFSDTVLDILFPDNGASAVGITMGCRGLDPCNLEDTIVEVYGEGGVLLDDITVNLSTDFEFFMGIESMEPITNVRLIDSDEMTSFLIGVQSVSFARISSGGSSSGCTIADTGAENTNFSGLTILTLIPVFVFMRREYESA